jgi:hypothetical protein
MKKQLLCFIILAICGSAYAQVPSYVPSNGLVGWYPFNGNANDASSFSNNGSVIGATLCNNRNGQANSAYSFTSSNTYINTSKAPFTNPPFTVSQWFYTNDFNNMYTTIGLGEVGGNNLKKLYITPNYNPGTPSIGTAGSNDITSTSNVCTSKNWTHLVVVVNSYSVNGVKFYVNGKLCGANTSGGGNSPFPLSNVGFSIGRHFSAPAPNWFNGYIDDIGLWNRALDTNEIKDLYKSCEKVITVQPQNVTTSKRWAQLTCNANDTLQVFQWQKFTNNTWVDINDDINYAGAKTNSLLIKHMLSKNNGDQYRCYIVGQCLKAYTNVASIQFNCVANVTKQPINQGMYGGRASFDCSSSDTLKTYQWQSDIGMGWHNLSNAGQYTGVNTDSLFINNTSLINNTQLFRCIIKGDCINDTTQEATLRVWGLGINGVNLPEFKLYPNPSSNAVTIAYSQNPYSIAVYNSLGQMVLSQNALTNEHTFDISQWPKGVYYVELIDAVTQTNKVQKLIRN